MTSISARNHRLRVKLIFNPGSGSDRESPVQLLDILKIIQNWKITPETFIISPGCDLASEIHDSVKEGIRLFVVCGGDGTVSSTAKILAGQDVNMGIIPTGTQNNIAKSLGIPTQINDAIALLRSGNSQKVDIGLAVCGKKSTPFIEVCSVGLFSALFEAGDDIQHGNIGRVGDFISTLTSSPPSNIYMEYDDGQKIKHQGHMVMVCNMPFAGQHFRVGCLDAYKDGRLDVVYSSDLTKLNMIGYMFKGNTTDTLEDSRIDHIQVRSIQIETDPPMPIMADGIAIGDGHVEIKVWQRALRILVESKEAKLITAKSMQPNSV